MLSQCKRLLTVGGRGGQERVELYKGSLSDIGSAEIEVLMNSIDSISVVSKLYGEAESMLFKLEKDFEGHTIRFSTPLKLLLFHNNVCILHFAHV